MIALDNKRVGSWKKRQLQTTKSDEVIIINTKKHLKLGMERTEAKG